MATRLKQLHITKIALVPKGANQEAHVLLYKSATPPEEEDMAETVAKADHDAVLAKLAKAEADVATLTEQVKKLTPTDPEDIWKGVSPAIKKLYEEQTERTRKAEEAIALEKAEREKGDYIRKAASYKFLPIKADDDWEVFKALATLPQPVQQRIDTLLAAAEANGRQAGLTQTLGRDGVPSGDAAPAAQLATMAKSYVEKGLVKTYNEGMSRATQERPDLYRAHSLDVQREERT